MTWWSDANHGPLQRPLEPYSFAATGLAGLQALGTGTLMQDTGTLYAGGSGSGDYYVQTAQTVWGSSRYVAITRVTPTWSQTTIYKQPVPLPGNQLTAFASDHDSFVKGEAWAVLPTHVMSDPPAVVTSIALQDASNFWVAARNVSDETEGSIIRFSINGTVTTSGTGAPLFASNVIVRARRSVSTVWFLLDILLRKECAGTTVLYVLTHEGVTRFHASTGVQLSKATSSSLINSVSMSAPPLSSPRGAIFQPELDQVCVACTSDPANTSTGCGCLS